MLETKLTALSLPYREALACHEGLRRLGFKPDDIYMMLVEQDLYVSLRVQDLEFNIELGAVEKTADEFPEYWGQIADRFNTCPEEEASEIWEASFFKKSFEKIAILIRSKGILLPKLAN
ncbi:MAG TPA: hypothetical protein VM577_19080 [Anaerovoracaceae bacterium]|nr:hypothetical protein [Anaerovoracaceae bacterium]